MTILIEYFCKDCGLAIWSKWLFSDHNGHRLAEINEVVKLVLKEMEKVKVKLEAAQIVNTHNLNFIKHIKYIFLVWCLEKILKNLGISKSKI